MRVIGIAGVGGTGKSELGRALRANETNCADLEYSDLLMGMANRLRHYIAEGVIDTRTDSSLCVANYIRTFFYEAFRRVTGGEISANQPPKDRLEEAINGRLFTYVKTLPDQDIRVPISRETKHEHQPFFQWLGGTVTRDAPGLLDRTMYDMVKKAETNGAEFTTIGGLRYPENFALVREFGGKVVKVLRANNPANPFVGADIVDQSEPDVIVHNNGTIDQLDRVATHIHTLDLSATRPEMFEFDTRDF